MAKDYATGKNFEDVKLRLKAVEEELMGNKDTGRPSLREELTIQNKSIKRVVVSILVAVIVAIILNWFGVGSHELHIPDAQAQSK